MPKKHLLAAAEGLPCARTVKAITRRCLVAGIAATGTAAFGAAFLLPAAAAPADAADVLYRDYVARIPEKRRLEAACDAARGVIPAWAKPGPRYLTRTGSYEGEVVPWPLDMTVKPAPWVNKVCRPGPHDLRRTYDMAMSEGAAGTYDGGLVRRDDVLTWYRSQLRSLAARRRAQRVEVRASGIEALDAAWDDHVTQMVRVRNDIEELPPSLNSAAALLLLEAVFKDKGAAVDSLEISTLAHMRPMLTGLIREHVDLLLKTVEDDQTAKLEMMPFDG